MFGPNLPGAIPRLRVLHVAAVLDDALLGDLRAVPDQIVELLQTRPMPEGDLIPIGVGVQAVGQVDLPQVAGAGCAVSRRPRLAQCRQEDRDQHRDDADDDQQFNESESPSPPVRATLFVAH